MSVAFLQEKFPEFAILKLAPLTLEFEERYYAHINAHNKSILDDCPFSNSGFDLLVPETTTVMAGMKTQMISMGVKAEMIYKNETTCGYFMFPRSSLSKTPLMLANHTGIIDSGYRGPLIGAFRNLGEDYIVEKDSRLLQICHPSLCPIYVVISNDTDLSFTGRGAGGFGSTGK